MCEAGEISIVSMSFNWIIPEFNKRIQMSPLDYLNSPTFQYEGNKWHLTVKVMDKNNTKPYKYVELYINREHSRFTQTVGVTLEYRTSHGKEMETCNVTANFDEGQSYWGPATLLLNMDAVLGPANTMTVYCNLEKDLVEEEESESEESSDEEEELNAIQAECCASLYEDMKKMFYDQIGWDVCLVVSGYTFPAHISVLSCRSPVFFGMLKDHPKSLYLEDCETDVFITFLEFLYLGKIDDPSATNAIKLYRLAHRYEVSLLKKQCLDILHRCLSLDTVCDVLRLAKECCEIKLLEEATEFFMKNHSEILDRKEWIQFLEEDPLLANEFMKQIVYFIRSKQTQTD